MLGGQMLFYGAGDLIATEAVAECNECETKSKDSI